MSSSTNASKSPLEAAQNIVEQLTGMTPEHQFLAIKFACETLNLGIPSVASSAAASIGGVEHKAPVASVGAIQHSNDIRSFTTMKAPRSDQQFCAVVAYFYQFEAKIEDRKDSIDSDTMREAARLAGRAQVERWNMTLTNAKNAGYLDPAGNGKYKLSPVGENLVAITLPEDAGPPRKPSNNKLKTMTKKRAAKKKRK